MYPTRGQQDMTRNEETSRRHPIVGFRKAPTEDGNGLGGFRKSGQGHPLDLPLFRSGNGPQPVAIRNDAKAIPLAVSDSLSRPERNVQVIRESGDAGPTINKADINHSRRIQFKSESCQAMSDDLTPDNDYSEGMIDERAERQERAARLREARVKAGFKTQAEAIRSCGWPSAAYKQHENGRNGFNVAQARQYARRYKVSTNWLMTGHDGIEQVETAYAVAPVVGEVAAGRWLSVDYHDEAKWDPVPFIPGRYEGLSQTAYRVVGPSMNQKHIEDGDFLITVPYFEARSAPQSHDIVIVETSRDGEVERTCKELIISLDAYELWPRSNHPSYTSPIIIPKSKNEATGPWNPEENGRIVSLVGLVIGRFRPFGVNY